MTSMIASANPTTTTAFSVEFYLNGPNIVTVVINKRNKIYEQLTYTTVDPTVNGTLTEDEWSRLEQFHMEHIGRWARPYIFMMEPTFVRL